MKIFIICIFILIIIKPLIFYGSLVPISIINRIILKRRKDKENGHIAPQISHSGIIGFVGRSILAYIRFASLKVGYIPLMCVRKFIYERVFLLNIEKGVAVHYGTEILGGENIKIDKNTIVGDKVILDGRNKLYIGKNVNIGTEVKIYTNQHNYKSPSFDSYDDDKLRVIIEDYVWLCTNCMIMPGCKIGKGAVVGAGAIVTNDVSPYSIVAGVPAKEIGKRPKNQNYELNYSTVHFW